MWHALPPIYLPPIHLHIEAIVTFLEYLLDCLRFAFSVFSVFLVASRLKSKLLSVA